MKLIALSNPPAYDYRQSLPSPGSGFRVTERGVIHNNKSIFPAKLHVVRHTLDLSDFTAYIELAWQAVGKDWQTARVAQGQQLGSRIFHPLKRAGAPIDIRNSRQVALYVQHLREHYDGLIPTEVINVEMVRSPIANDEINCGQSKVYLILADNGLVKIGTTQSVYHRFSKIQTDCAEFVRVLCAFDGDEKIEDRVHKMFSEDCSHGEWYFFRGRVKAFYEALL